MWLKYIATYTEKKKKKFSKDKDSFCSSFHVPVHHPVSIAVYPGFSESSYSSFHWSQCTIIFLQFSLGYSRSTVKHKQDTRDRPYLSTVGPFQRASACQQFLWAAESFFLLSLLSQALRSACDLKGLLVWVIFSFFFTHL